MESLKELVQHPLALTLSYILSILGLVLGYVLYRLSKREKKPCWSITGSNLIHGFSATLPNLEVKYDGKDVENLTITKLVFWNAGKETINGTDIADADKLRIVPTNDAELLDVKIVYANSGPSNVSVSPDEPDTAKMAALLTFDFLDKDQGVVVQVIHTGSSIKDITLKGTIKGAGIPKYLESKPTTMRNLITGIVSVVVSMSIILIAFGIMERFKLGQIVSFIVTTSLTIGSLTGMILLMPPPLFRTPKQLRNQINPSESEDDTLQ